MKRRALLTAASLLPLAKAVPAEPALWAARFATPAGTELALSSLRGRWVLLNFWATWCAPCLKEMPDLDAFQSAHPSWAVVGLAIDGPTPVRQFLAKRPVGFAIGLAGLNGSELMRTLGNTKGGLPYTVIAAPDGRIAWRHAGLTDLKMLQAQRQALKAS